MKVKKPARNLHACHPIMKKGGVHEKSRGAKRAASKKETRRKKEEWLGRSSSSISSTVKLNIALESDAYFIVMAA